MVRRKAVGKSIVSLSALSEVRSRQFGMKSTYLDKHALVKSLLCLHSTYFPFQTDSDSLSSGQEPPAQV